jgi:hypothetical protein
VTEFEPASVSLVITEIAVPATSHATDRHSTSTITAPTTATSGDCGAVTPLCPSCIDTLLKMDAMWAGAVKLAFR